MRPASPTASTLVVNVPNAIISRLDEIARAAGLTRSQVVRMILSDANREAIPQEFYARAEALRPIMA